MAVQPPQNGYGFKTNGGSQYVDLGNWTNDTCFVDVDTCEQGIKPLNIAHNRNVIKSEQVRTSPGIGVLNLGLPLLQSEKSLNKSGDGWGQMGVCVCVCVCVGGGGPLQ